MSRSESQATGLQALDAQILLAESRLVKRELLLRSQGRLLLTRVNDSVVRRLGQGAVAMAGALLLRRFLRPRAAAARATEVPPALGIGPWLMQTLWPLVPKPLRTYVSPALALSLLGQLSSLWSIRHRSSSKPPQDPP
ncbi:MAG: hypothetical protein IV097_13740 [Burkholderiaceae bacterium]|nr:hypothetical protein [Burkholderiaceae bacterium]